MSDSALAFVLFMIVAVADAKVTPGMPARRGRAMTIRRPDDIAHAGVIETAAKPVQA